MVRQFGVVVLAAVIGLAAMNGTLNAQGRGRGGRGGGFGPARPVPVAPGPAAPRGTFNRPFPGPVNRHIPGPFVTPRVGVVPGVTIVRPRPRVIFSQPFVPYTGFYSPFVWSSPFYSAPVYSEPAYVAPTVNQNTADLTYEVQRLSQEIEQLRQEQALSVARQAAPEPPPPPPFAAEERPAVPIVLVFRDGRHTTIQNYAIVGQTLWVLDEKTSTKILLSDLDLDATERENRGQGLRLPLPKR
jgi:hypothetical protein